MGYKDAIKSSEEFISLAEVVEMNKAIIDACIELRKKKRIKLPDAIIAATAVVLNYTLVTNNNKDFEGIKALEIINPYHI